MPDPQPGWCQQYNYEMVPIWARGSSSRPRLSGWESQDVMETLIKIARYTGKQKYLEPIPRALGYFKKCLLPDGRVARYYEFKTNRPLYMDAEYRLTYDDSAAPVTTAGSSPPASRRSRRRTRTPERCRPRRTRSARELEEDVRRIIRELDKEGRWMHHVRRRATRRAAEVRPVVPLHLQRRLQPQHRDPE